MPVNFLIYYFDTDGALLRTGLISQIQTKYEGCDLPNVSIKTGTSRINEFKEHLNLIISKNPKQLFIIPTCMATENTIDDISNFIEEISASKEHRRQTTDIRIAPLIFVSYSDFIKMKEKFNGINGNVDTFFLVSDTFRNGTPALESDWAVTYEMFLETVIAIGKFQPKGILHKLSTLNSFSTFGFSIRETPIRKLASEVLFKHYLEFVKKQHKTSNNKPLMDVTEKIKIANTWIKEAVNKKIPDIEKSYNPFADKQFTSFSWMVKDSVIVNESSNRDKDDNLYSYAEQQIKGLLEDIFDKVTKNIHTLKPSDIENEAVERKKEDFEDIKNWINSFLTRGDPIEDLKSAAVYELDSLGKWQKDNIKAHIPPLTVEEAEKSVGIDAAIRKHAGLVRGFAALIKKWLNLKEKRILWYMRFFIPSFLFLTILLGWLTLKVGISLNDTSMVIIATLSAFIATLIILYIRNLFLEKYAKIAQQKLIELSKGFSETEKFFSKNISEQFLAYIGIHTTVKLSYFYRNFLQSIKNKCGFFQKVFKTKDFRPSTMSTSKLISYLSIADVGKLSRKLEENSPDLPKRIYSGFLDVVSSKEVETKISYLLNELEMEAVAKQRENYQLSEIAPGEIADLFEKTTKHSIPLPLKEILPPKTAFEDGESHIKRFETIICSKNCNLGPTTLDKLYWDRYESLLYAIFHGGISLNDFNERVSVR